MYRVRLILLRIGLKYLRHKYPRYPKSSFCLSYISNNSGCPYLFLTSSITKVFLPALVKLKTAVWVLFGLMFPKSHILLSIISFVTPSGFFCVTGIFSTVFDKHSSRKKNVEKNKLNIEIQKYFNRIYLNE